MIKAIFVFYIFFFSFFLFPVYSLDNGKDPVIKSIELIKLGKLEDAFVIVNEQLEDKKTDKFLYLQGIIYERLDDYRHALKSYKKILDDYYTSDFREIAYISSISCLEHLGEYNRLKNMMKDFLSEYPDSKYKDKIKNRLGEL